MHHCSPGRILCGLGAALVLLLCLFAHAPGAQTLEPRLDVAPLATGSIPIEACGTEFEYLRSLGVVRPRALEDGQALMFDQVPAILTPDLTGNFSLQAQLVGDFDTMRFRRWDP